jgi:aminopeptidase N
MSPRPGAFSCLAAFLLAALIPAVASAQTRPHNFKLLEVRWYVKLDEPTASFSGDVTNTLRPDMGATSVDLDFGDLTIDSITVDGTAATYKHAGEALTIALPAAVDGARSVAIRVQYHGVPHAGMYFVPAARAFPAHTPVVYTQGEMVDNRFWLPTYDYPDDKATIDGTINVPEGWFALSNGALLDTVTRAGRTIYHWKLDQPVATYLISFVAGPYEKGHEEWDSIPVDYYVPNGLLVQGKSAFGGTANIVRVYSELTGVRYPWVKYSQAAVPDFMFGGMENVTCTTQTIQALHPPSAEPVEDSVGLAAHELAHQWFGDYVTCNGWSDAWLNEGWATFMPTFYSRATKGQEAFDAERYDTFSAGLGASLGDTTRPVVWKGYHDALDMFNGMIYPGGASRLFMLMRLLGEDRFWKATKAYLEQNKYQSIDTDVFFKSFAKSTGKTLDWFEKQWFFSPGAPVLTVSKDGSRLIVKQSGASKFALDLPVWVLVGGTWIKHTLKLDGPLAALDLGSNANKPVLVDPECWVMASIQYTLHQTPAERMEVFLAAPNVGEQLRYMDSNLGELTLEQNIELAKAIKSPIVKRRFINRLQEGSQGYLVELTRSSDLLLADAALNHLGGLKSNDTVLARLRELAANDPNDAIRETAFRMVLNQTNDASLADKAWAMDGFRDAYRQMALRWWAQNKPDLARERALEAIAKSYPEPTRVTAIQLLGNLKDRPGSHQVYDALVGILNEQSFGARMADIGALAEYGNRAALPLIKPYLTAELVFFRMVASGAVGRLGGG